MTQYTDILQVSGVQELDFWHTEVEPVWQARLSPTYNFHVLLCHACCFPSTLLSCKTMFGFRLFLSRGRSVKIAILSEELSLQSEGESEGITKAMQQSFANRDI